MNLLFAIPWFHPATRFGGPVSQLERLGRELVGRGHRVSILTTDNGIHPDLPRNQWVETEGGRVFYARTRPWDRPAPYRMPAAARRQLPGALAEADLL
ncbi:MAG: hypothetical protein R3336_10675, partial [Phycisphaeraceae bacterium]|nr:hypothetical protein [Phycisphaeraceae bacterium]